MTSHPPKLRRASPTCSLYSGFTKAELARTLTTFLLVGKPVKVAKLNVGRNVETGLVIWLEDGVESLMGMSLE